MYIYLCISSFPESYNFHCYPAFEMKQLLKTEVFFPVLLTRSLPMTFVLVIIRRIYLYKSSRPEVFFKKGVLKNFTKFTGKHLCQSLFFNKVAGRPATLLKKRLWHRCFPVNFVKFLRTPISIEHLWWLLLPLPLQMQLSKTQKTFTAFYGIFGIYITV